MNIVKETQPDMLVLEEERVYFRYVNGNEDKLMSLLNDTDTNYELHANPSKNIFVIYVDIKDYIKILGYIVDIENDKYTGTIHLNDAVVHINNVGAGHCTKISVDPNGINVYRNDEELFNISTDLHEINQFSIATDIGSKRYMCIPLEWFDKRAKEIEEVLDFESDY